MSKMKESRNVLQDSVTLFVRLRVGTGRYDNGVSGGVYLRRSGAFPFPHQQNEQDDKGQKGNDVEYMP